MRSTLVCFILKLSNIQYFQEAIKFNQNKEEFYKLFVRYAKIS